MHTLGDVLKVWMKKLVDQFTLEWDDKHDSPNQNHTEMTEERASLLYILDIFNKHLFEIEGHPVRKIRAKLDEFSKALVKGDSNTEKVLFELRQFFSSYRIDETTYIQNTFDDFKKIIWEFADHLSEDIKFEKMKDNEISKCLDELREAVESDSIQVLKKQSREFINSYVRAQGAKDQHREKRLVTVRKSLNSVKKKLVEANHTMRTDHLTQVFNRRSFDESMANYHRLCQVSGGNLSLLLIDIDYFKRINDTFGHDVGDFVLKECASMIKKTFARENDIVARIGGEEFAVILPDYDLLASEKKAEELMAKVRREAVISGQHEIRFTVSLGVAQLKENETSEELMKRADQALYEAKHGGRDRAVLSEGPKKSKKSAS
jgi:diguanylate cyclase (GGDEF)-like protein